MENLLDNIPEPLLNQIKYLGKGLEKYQQGKVIMLYDPNKDDLAGMYNIEAKTFTPNYQYFMILDYTGLHEWDEQTYIYNNIVINTGRDGIQVGSAVEDCEIYNNYVELFGQKSEGGHMTGFQINPGTTGKLYNNVINASDTECCTPRAPRAISNSSGSFFGRVSNTGNSSARHPGWMKKCNDFSFAYSYKALYSLEYSKERKALLGSMAPNIP